jgi:hypothetical protein
VVNRGLILKLRETTAEDREFVAEHSISHGTKDVPEQTDFWYTVEHEGEVMCVGGFRLLNKTTAWCHVNLTDRAGGHIIHLYRIIRDWIDEFVKEHDIRRLQAYVLCDFQEGVTMVNHLGFTKESIMLGFSEGKSAYMFTRLF